MYGNSKNSRKKGSSKKERSGKRARFWGWGGALAAGLFLPSSACAAGGVPESRWPGDYRTQEYQASQGLEAIHAADAYALGYTGKGVRVGVVDDGDVLDHHEFSGRTLQWALIGPARSMEVGWRGEHSTAVAGVLAAARDGRGMHGVAHEAELISISYGTPNGGTQGGAAIPDAVDRGARVINGSYGYDVFPLLYADDGNGNMVPRPQAVQTFLLDIDGRTIVGHSEEVQALRYAAAHDVVMVYAAGNEYLEHPVAAMHPSSMGLLPYIRPANHGAGVYRIVDPKRIFHDPRYGAEDFVTIDPTDSRLQDLDFSDIEATVIAVVAVGPNKQIASYSNSCGVAWRWCMAAPGGDYPYDARSWSSSAMTVPYGKNGYAVDGIIGTSFAAPMVTGALAVMQHAFPYMTMRQLREIVLTSADRTGHLADPFVYGWGLLDLGRAVRGPVEFGAAGFAPVFDVDTRGHDSWWSNDIVGSGGMTKRGRGLLVMTGHNTYTGPTTVKGGTLGVYGSIARSAVRVERDGTLAGTGTVGSAEVAGTVAPGNPGAALRVAGNYVQHTEGIYVAGISEDGSSSDLIEVQGSARIDNATLRIEGIGPKAVNRDYIVLRADGGIQGSYAKVPDPYLFLDLDQGVRGSDPTRYRFAVRRDATPFATAARTPNQRAVAAALDTAGVGVAPYDVTVMATQADGLTRRFDRWSGEAHASALTAFTMQSAQVRDGMLGRAQAMGRGYGAGSGAGSGRGGGGASAVGGRFASAQSQSVVQDDTGKAVWAQYAGARDRMSGNLDTAGFDATSSGLFLGADMPLPGRAGGGARLGLMAGFTSGGMKVRDRGSHAKVDSYTLGAYGNVPLSAPGDGAADRADHARTAAGVQVRYGAAYTWHGVSARRETAGLETAEGRYKAGTAQVFAEAGLPYALGGVTVEPYAGLAWVDTRRRAFRESGNAALHADAAAQRLGYSTLGLRGDTGGEMKDGSRWALHAGAGWRHAYGNIAPAARVRFAQGNGFDVQGTPVARDAMLLEAGASVYTDRGMRLGLGYTAQLARGAQSHALKADAVWMF
ncbi:hypothetical protein AKI39_06175 [Bordetella sp. H567]|uniref:autotransporter serine protease n=1 Tax=Bordetella sp. H567 TaxID=1697043 RepID=UPI00081C5915|nr:autotransporter serine protease [Bordetella sp. H567]AOB30371.1 hypothetical protein AKI39_06175 [Bordetella sp. H567]